MTVLGDLVDIRTGKLDANAAVADGNYPFFTCAEKISYIDIYAFDADAIIVAGNGDLNVKHYKGKFNAYQRTYVITIPDETLIDSRYLFHWMSKYITKLRAMSIGGVIKYIKLGMLADATLPLPPLAEQKRIAAILDKADALRRKREKAIQLTDTLLKSVFLDMFGDPVTNPKGWEIATGEQVFDELRYGTSEKSTLEVTARTIPVLRIPNIQKGKLHFGELKYISLHENEAKKLLLKRGDILFVRSNGNPDYIGRCGVFSEDEKYIFASYLIRARITDEFFVSPNFLSALLSFPTFRSKLVAEARTTAGNYNISTTGLRNLKFITPSRELQTEYIKLSKELNNSLLGQEEIAQKAHALFASLSQRAFRGELTGKDIDQIEAA